MLNDFRRVLTMFAGFIIGMHTAVFFHELGHALGYLLSGGTVTAIVMQAPLPAGYVTGTSPNRFIHVWGGVGFGTLVAVVPLLAAARLPRSSRLCFALKMLAAFCLAHNGMYLFVGSLLPFADASNMIALGAPRWLLFLLGVPLVAGFIFVLTPAIQLVDFDPRETIGKWIVLVEMGLWSFPAFMATSMIFMTVPPSVRMPTLAFVGCYAACYAAAAYRAFAASRRGDSVGIRMPPNWVTTFALLLTAALMITVEWLALRPA
jgi:hypothetical protein